ncbi:FlgO family outer membrane protein [Psychromonas antarctica]|jgi:TolB-like protein|uniref:FlgO family outer membrane protein n=1 Tax=Psychromonas antarctica TaxID=67573 RepID=UPI001EE9A791|nr:FlgO family outer membrane protein [Psychromonas antarctica]MCG6199761.1 hypothetical protein [Psychromonas antarctica]
MRNLLVISITLLLLQGCTQLSSDESEKDVTPVANIERASSDDSLYYYIAHSTNQSDENLDVDHDALVTAIEPTGYGHLYLFNGEKSLILSDVVSKMADQLLSNFPQKYRFGAIALTSIVDLRDHQVTNWVGQTISEQFIHELHIRDLNIIDFKLTGDIQLTPQGEFALTRDWKKLSKSVDVQHILAGTMSRNEEGLIINVRIVNINSKRVESTSSAFIPETMFVGGEYDYQNKKYFSRDSDLAQKGRSQVRLVK